MILRTNRLVAAAVLVAFCVGPACAEPWRAEQSEGAIRFLLGETVAAEYVYQDETITRPYFTRLRSPEGIQVTRNHPPVEGEDRMDHADYHPGVWLAFGDLSGSDNWRLKAKVEHVRFIQQPVLSEESIAFAVENRYANAEGETVCRSICRHSLTATPAGVLLTYDVTFSADEPFTFGDQEEMGLGVRVATPLRVEQGGPNPAPQGTGEMAASGGRRGASQVWGQPADWVDYRGTLDGAAAGLAIFCHPGNYRPSRMHARDYGFICANPFSRAAFDAGLPLTTTVEPGESLRLRYGVLSHSGELLSDDQLEAAHRAYVAASP